MRRLSLWRRSLAEFLGTGLLVTVVVGSGIAAERLSTDPGLQLLENSIATALGLDVAQFEQLAFVLGSPA